VPAMPRGSPFLTHNQKRPRATRRTVRTLYASML
jgi:hypothetical protein